MKDDQKEKFISLILAFMRSEPRRGVPEFANQRTERLAARPPLPGRARH